MTIFDTCDNVSIEIEGKAIYGMLSYSSKGQAKKPLIVLNSGFGPSGSKSNTWETFIDKISSSNCDCAILNWDYVGQGHSEGDIVKLTPFLALDQMRKMITNARLHTIVNGEVTGIYGSSFGGYIALLYAALYGKIDALFLKSPASDYAEVRRITLGCKKLDTWREKGEIEVEEYVNSPFDFFAQSKAIDIYKKIAPDIKSVVKIVHGDADTNVPVSQSLLLKRSLRRCELEIFPGVGHGYKENNGLEKVSERAVNFFRKNIC